MKKHNFASYITPPKKVRQSIFLAISAVALFSFSGLSQAGMVNDTINQLFNTQATALEGIILKAALTILGALAVLQCIKDGYGLITSGQGTPESVLYRFVGIIFFAALAATFIEKAPALLKNILDSFANAVLGVSGGIAPDELFMTGVEIMQKMLASFNSAIGLTPDSGTLATASAWAVNMVPGLLLVGCIVVILATFAIIAANLFMAKLEGLIVLMAAPIAFALIGFSGTRQQGFSPFQYVLSLVMRIAILAVIAGVAAAVSPKVTATLAAAAKAGSMNELWPQYFGVMFVYVLLAMAALRANALAGALASGSSSMSTGDAIGSGVATTAAAGGAAAVGGAAGGLVGSAIGSTVSGSKTAASALSTMAGNLLSPGLNVSAPGSSTDTKIPGGAWPSHPSASSPASSAPAAGGSGFSTPDVAPSSASSAPAAGGSGSSTPDVAPSPASSAPAAGGSGSSTPDVAPSPASSAPASSTPAAGGSGKTAGIGGETPTAANNPSKPSAFSDLQRSLEKVAELDRAHIQTQIQIDKD